MKRLKRVLLYAGRDREEYHALAPRALERNARELRIYSTLALAVFVILIVANLLTRDRTDVNLVYYVVMALIDGAICLCAWRVLPGRPNLSMAMVYVFMITLYGFSLSLTAAHADMLSVSTIVLMFAIPFLFTDRPLRMVCMTALVAAALCAVSLRFKAPEVARMDIWNGLTFAVVGSVVEVIQQCSRFNSLSQARTIRYLSETDVLTGAKNRNRFERRRDDYARLCRSNVVCVYVDVNGLHELNNNRGHKAGDNMLRAVPSALTACFGVEHTYRLGGDEFVTYRLDVPEARVREDMARITAALQAEGYHISVGVSSAGAEALDMAALTAEAEAEMYRDKHEFYRHSSHDRRRR